MNSTPFLRLVAAFSWVAVMLTTALVLQGCVTNTATGRSQFNYLSREDEIAVGQEAAPQLIQEYGGAVTDPAVNQYITGVAMSMVRHTEADYSTLPWKFTLLNSPVINAFALPGGQVFISRALAEKFKSEAELAGVLGHEIGHVTAEHADRGIGRQMVLQGIAVTAGVLAGNDAAAQQVAEVFVSSAGTFALTYDREQESEADRLGMRYMVKAGYHPQGMQNVMKVLAAESAGKTPPEWQSTHPNPETRIKEIGERLNAENWRRLIAETNPQYFEARFQQQFLDRMRGIPYPPQQQSRIDLAHPELWCWHCAARRSASGEAARAN